MLQQAAHQAVEVNGTYTTGILNVTLTFGNLELPFSKTLMVLSIISFMANAYYEEVHVIQGLCILTVEQGRGERKKGKRHS